MSYSPVYSAQFINYSGDTSGQSFLVPAGFTAVVRQISYTAQAAAVEAGVYYQNSDEAPNVWIDTQTIEALVQTVHVRGHWVVPENATLALYVTTIGYQFYCYVGGYLLRNVIS